MCRLYGVTRAGFYVWRSRGHSERAQQNDSLTAEIRAVHGESRGTYGSPRVHRTLQRRGHRIGKHRVARLMRRHGIKARVATIRYTSPRLQRFYASIANQQLDLKLERPDQVWVGDITYLKVGNIYRYLAVVMDKYSRRVVGWAYGPHKDVPLTLKALNRAVRHRKPGRGLVFHTDRGTEYAAGTFKKRIAELGFVQSMNRPGKMTDNAFIESFFHSMKADVFHGRQFDDDDVVRSVLKDYLPFYNRARLHSSLDYVSPATFEQQAGRTGCQ
jgi:putative transposase